jgi:hypothetical protein
MRAVIILLLAAAGCGDNVVVAPAEDAALPIDAGVDASPAVGPCLDRTTDLPRPPSGQLPCELLPPGFGS